MSTNNLELRVTFAAIDKFVRPVNAITGAAKEAAQAVRDNNTRLKELNRTVEQIDAFKKAQKDAAIAANTFEANRRKLDELREAAARMGVPTKKMAAEMAELSRRSAELKDKHESLLNTEQRLFERLRQSGVDTHKLTEERRRLASASAEATTASQRLQAALVAENEKMRRLRAAQADLEKAKEKAGKIAMAGAGIAAGGAALGLPVAKAGKDFADFETAMLGVARQMDGARDANGKVTASYWEMAAAIKAMSERLPGTSADIAKIVEGGARMGIQGKENLLIYAETTAVMAKAFDLPVDTVGESVGKLSQLYKVPIKDIKALGDTINWLDDNALAKGGDIINVMERIAGTADMAKMTFRDAAALGSTFLSLGANAEVAASASNAMIRELSVANMQSKRFKEGMAMLGLNGKDVQTGMSKDATGTIIKVLEKIKGLAGDKQLEAATRIFGKEFGDDAAKLASNLDEYRRQLELVRDQKAFGSMQREADAWGDTLNARIENAKDAFSNLSSDLGKELKPAIASSMETTLAMVQAVRGWAAENPKLAGGLMTVLKYLALAATIIGGIGIAAGAVLVPLAALKFSMVTLGIQGFSAMGLLGSGMAVLRGAITAVTMTMMANPILAIITGIALAAGLIYANWDKIGPWFSGLIGRISATLSGLKDSALTAGGDLMNGLIAGITGRWEALRSTVVGVAESTIGWVKEKLGIRSPSRVFAELGMHTMDGLAQGLEDNADGPFAALSAATKKLTSIGAGIALGAAPMMAAAGGGAAPAGGNVYQVTVYAAPGTDSQGLAALVVSEIEKFEAKKQTRQRSSLRDSH